MMTLPSGLRRGGRPRKAEQPSRLDALFDVATDVFLEHGFSGASMALIARRGQASKETLYNHFGSKEQLFSQIIAELSLRITRGVAPRQGVGAHQVLQLFGEQLLDVVLDPRTTSLYRLLAAEGARSAEIGAIFDRNGPERSRAAVKRVLESLVESGDLVACDPAIAGRQFASLVVGDFFQRSIIGVLAPLTLTERQAWVSEAVAMFMARYGKSNACLEAS